MIEKARALGVRNICIHKGLPFGKLKSTGRSGIPSGQDVPGRELPGLYPVSQLRGGPYDLGRGEASTD